LVKAAIALKSVDLFGKTNFLRQHLKQIDDSISYVPVPKTPQPVSSEELLDSLGAPLEQMSKIGTFEKELAVRLISLGAMNSERYSSFYYKTLFKFYEGRLYFGQSKYNEAITLFRQAEESWPEGKEARSKLLSKIRLRIAICERHLGRLDNAKTEMHRALRLRDGVDWGLFQQVTANLGAFYMYTDQAQAKFCWAKGLGAAQHTRDQHQISHFMNDLGHIEIMLDNFEDAKNIISEASSVADRYGILKESIRSNIFFGCISLAQNKLENALFYFLKAENDAFTQYNLRRLWRIRANMATLAELRGDIKKAYVKDVQSLVHMPLEYEMEKVINGSKRRSRVSGALVNIVCRYNQAPDLYSGIKKKMSDEIWNYAKRLSQILADTPDDPDGMLGGTTCLYKAVGDNGSLRFLLTE
jgi:tetratricopeptide (TPR) repeat protein